MNDFSVLIHIHIHVHIDERRYFTQAIFFIVNFELDLSDLT